MKWCDWLCDCVDMFDRCPHENVSLMAGLRVSMKTSIFLKSTNLAWTFHFSPTLSFFRILKKLQLLQEHHMILTSLSTYTYTTCAHFVYFHGTCDWHPRGELLRNSSSFQNPIISSGFTISKRQNSGHLDEINLYKLYLLHTDIINFTFQPNIHKTCCNHRLQQPRWLIYHPSRGRHARQSNGYSG